MRLSPTNREELGIVEPFWQAQLAVLFALLLYLALPDRLTLGPSWLLPSLEGVLLLGLAISTPYRHHSQSQARRRLSIGLIAIVTVANFTALGLLVHLLLERNTAAGRDLIIAAGQIWLTNVAVFGLWFWEIDRGGPHLRTAPEPREPDFLFPQMGVPDLPFQDWRPGFVDYLYVAFTNASAFSPTDAMPLSVRVKALMLAEAMASFMTVGLIAARAVNILG
ncbi:MAG: hypothetical protein WB507_04030 [Solirubrobacterales bacterium]